MREMVEKVAGILRVARQCDAGEVPCPFCRWAGEDPTGAIADPVEESGCLWWAERIVRAMREPTGDMLEHPSYATGEWSRRNVEAYVDAALAEENQPQLSP